MPILILRSVKGAELEYFEHDDNHRLSSLTIETVASLRLALSDFDKQLVFVESRATNGDGFSGHFYWDAMNTDLDDDQDTFQVTGTPVGRWRRIFLTESQISDLDKYTQAEVDAKDQALQDQITINDVQIGLRETASTGIIIGGGGSQINNAQISIPAGDGEIVDGYTDRRAPTVINITWPANPAMTINMPDPIGVQVIYADNTGTVLQKPNPLSATERRTLVQIAFVYYDDGVIQTVQHAGIHSNEVGNTLYDWMFYTDFAARTKGLGINPVDSALSIFSDSGTFISPGINVASSITNPNIGTYPAVGDINTPLVFDVKFADGNDYLTAQTVMPEFWESAPGVATALGGNDAAIHYIFRTFANTFIVQLGTTLYTNGAAARDSLETDRGSFTFFAGSQVTLPTSQAYISNNAIDFSDSAVAGIVSLIGSGTGSGGSVSITDWLSLSDVIPSTYVGNAGKYARVDAGETGIDTVDLTIIDDVAPQLGGNLETQGNDIVIESDLTTEQGRIATTLTNGIAFAKTTNGVYDPSDGGIAAESGILEIHGGVAQVKTLVSSDNSQVWANPDGSLFSVEPPPAGFTATDTDNGDYPLAGLGIFVDITGLSVVIPQVVAVGEPLQTIVNLHIVNANNNRGGTIDITLGINGAAPTNNGINKVISAGLDAIVPVSITTTNHGGLAVNDTIEIHVRRATEENGQFDPNVNGSVGAIHEFSVSNTATSGGASAWGTITGTLSDQTDLQTALDSKFDSSGGTITNSVEIINNLTMSGLNATILLQPDANTGVAQILLLDQAGNARLALFYNEGAGGTNTPFLTTRNSAGAVTSAIDFQENGLVRITSPSLGSVPIPTLSEHLVNKQYTDIPVDHRAVPAAATSTGTKGEIAADASFFYTCIATDTWVRAALATWP